MTASRPLPCFAVITADGDAKGFTTFDRLLVDRLPERYRTWEVRRTMQVTVDASYKVSGDAISDWPAGLILQAEIALAQLKAKGEITCVQQTGENPYASIFFFTP